jgi:hypothetical protein
VTDRTHARANNRDWKNTKEGYERGCGEEFFFGRIFGQTGSLVDLSLY